MSNYSVIVIRRPHGVFILSALKGTNRLTKTYRDGWTFHDAVQDFLKYADNA